MLKNILCTLLLLGVYVLNTPMYAQEKPLYTALTKEHKSLVRIAAFAAAGDLDNLSIALNDGLSIGLPIKTIQEALIHMYAYAGFPRSIRGLQTLLAVVEERQAKGIVDIVGRDASSVVDDRSKYERGKATLEVLTGVKESETKTGYAAFAPPIEVFLKEHLFADLFERDVLTYLERELITISVLSSIGGVEPMLRSHLAICINLGCSPSYLHEFAMLIKECIRQEYRYTADKVIVDILYYK